MYARPCLLELLDEIIVKGKPAPLFTCRMTNQKVRICIMQAFGVFQER